MTIVQLNRLILHSAGQKWAKARKSGAEVTYPHQPNELDQNTFTRTLAGDLSIGVMLAQDKTGLCKAGCIDIDSPRDAKDMSEGLALARKLQETARKCGLNAYIEFSGNRGYHVWLFVLKPVTYSLMQSTLKAIADRAGFNAKEIFPNAFPETKCIKLPGVIHLKSGNKCGFIDATFDPANPAPADNQAELMGGFIQNEVEALVAIATPPASKGEEATEDTGKLLVISDKLKKHFPSTNPACINHLLQSGAPVDIDYNFSNITLARYCVAKGLTDSEAVKLAEAMARNTSESHPTGKDQAGKVKNFKSAYRSAKAKGYGFECSYAVSKNLPLEERGCIGSQCPLADNVIKGIEAKQNPIQNSRGLRALNRVLYLSLVNIYFEGKQACKSKILRNAETLLSEGGNYQGEKLSEGEALAEAEAIAYLLREPEALTDHNDIYPSGFRAGSDKSLGEYIDYLLTLELPLSDNLSDNLSDIRLAGIKAEAKNRLENYKTSIDTNDIGEVLSGVINTSEGLLKRSINSQEIASMADHLADISSDLFSKEHRAIATYSKHLNVLLNGGLQPARLYVLGSPPGSGKSTFTHSICDFVSSNGSTTLYVSYEMSREQLFICSLSRLGRINSALIESKKFLDPDYKDKDNLETNIIEAVRRYGEKIAGNITILEADHTYTASKLKAVITKLKPALVIIDYLQLMASGDDRLDSSALEVQRISKIATDLKRLARDTDTAVIAISDINKQAFTQANKGNELDMGALRDSFKIAHAADCILLLQSGFIGEGNDRSDQLNLLSLKYPDQARLITKAREKYPLDHPSDTYARLTIVKNRGGRLGDPVFRYSKAFHSFDPIDLLELDTNSNSTEI